MVTLKIDNRSLLNSAKFSYLIDNYSSATSTVYVLNSEGIAVDNYIIIGNIWSETTELLRIASVTASTWALTFKDNTWAAASTKFAHSESTRVTVVPYDKVIFYFTLTSTFSSGTALTWFLDIQVNDFLSKYDDTVNSSWYGWALFYNTATALYSQPSNAIPYADFNQDTVKKTFDGFFSLLNNRELQLISYDDAYNWANEWYSVLRNELNLANDEFWASATISLPIIANQAEYDLPTDFSDLLSVNNEEWNPLDLITFRDIPLYAQITQFDDKFSSYPGYYIRDWKIGFVPTPTQIATYSYRYLTVPTTISSLTDIISLPNGAYYTLKDYMLSRAYAKLQNASMSGFYLSAFQKWIDRMKIMACKRDAQLDTWWAEPTTLV